MFTTVANFATVVGYKDLLKNGDKLWALAILQKSGLRKI